MNKAQLLSATGDANFQIWKADLEYREGVAAS